MEQLKLVWVYRFWVAIGMVAIMPIVSFFVDTQTLSKSAQARASLLKGLQDQLQKAASGPNPNDNWVTGVSELKDVLSQQVDVAWVDLYKRQAQLKTWPERVRDVYVAAGPDGEDKVDATTRVNYQESYAAQLEDLFAIVQPVGWAQSKELVEMEPEVIYNYRPGWAAVGQIPPTVRQAWLAQEDIWLLRALLRVIALANQESTKWQESAVKTIVDIELGTAAARDATLSKTAKEQLSPRGGYEAPSGTSTGGGREGGEIRGPLYSQVPVYVKLVVDQPSVLEVLAAFGNSEIPMLIKEVQIAEIPVTDRNSARLKHMQSEAAKKAGAAAQGTAPAQDDEFFQMVELEVYARAILYKKPPKVEEEERNAAALRAAGSTPPSAPPETATPN